MHHLENIYLHTHEINSNNVHFLPNMKKKMQNEKKPSRTISVQKSSFHTCFPLYEIFFIVNSA